MNIGPPPVTHRAMKVSRTPVMAVTTLGIGLGLAACGGGGGDAGPDGPASDGPATDGPIDAPVDAPSDGPAPDAGVARLSLSVEGTGAGVIFNDPLTHWCANQDCDDPLSHLRYQTYTFKQNPIAGSTFTGWSGCTPNADGTCSVYLEQDTVVTATYDAPPGVTWVRSAWPLYIADYPIFLDATADGVVAAGTGRDYANGGAWISRYLADGTQTSDGIVFLDPLIQPAVAHGVNAAGTHWFLVAEPPPPFPPGQQPRLRLRRVTQPAVAALPGGFASTHGLAVDAAGNAYVSGVVDGVPYLASYDLAGVERWRITPPGVLAMHALLVRGNLLVAGGTAAVGQLRPGWIGTYDLAGTPGWSRTVTLPLVSGLALDSDGDVIYGGVDHANTSYIAGAVSADGATEQWQQSFATRTAGAIAVRADDTLRVWLGSAANLPAPSTLLDLTEAGAQTASQNLPLPTPAAIVIDAAGTTFLAGPHNAGGEDGARRPALLRLP